MGQVPNRNDADWTSCVLVVVTTAVAAMGKAAVICMHHSNLDLQVLILCILNCAMNRTQQKIRPNT